MIMKEKNCQKIIESCSLSFFLVGVFEHHPCPRPPSAVHNQPPLGLDIIFRPNRITTNIHITCPYTNASSLATESRVPLSLPIVISPEIGVMGLIVAVPPLIAILEPDGVVVHGSGRHVHEERQCRINLTRSKSNQRLASSSRPDLPRKRMIGNHLPAAVTRSARQTGRTGPAARRGTG